MSKYFVLLGFIFLSGCLVRTYTLTKPRVDTDIQGNRGYLSGAPSQIAATPSRLSDVRKTSVVEIELGAHRRTSAVKKVYASAAPREVSIAPDEAEDLAPQATEEIAEEKAFQEYIVEKGDTLQKISQKFYGTTKKFQMLYEENKDVLKSPNKVYPGTKIRIPKK